MGAVRLLPAGGDGAIIVCRQCLAREIEFRKLRNIELSEEARFSLPKWGELELYNPQ